MDTGAITHLLITYKYWLLFPIACIEGPLVAFIAGMLSSLGYLNPGVAFALLVLGDIVPDGGFYALGRFEGRFPALRRLATRAGLTDTHIDQARRIWNAHPGKTMLMTKFAYGISSAFLVMAGVLRIPLGRFYRYSITISVIHYAIVMGTGYFFGRSIASLGDIVSMTETAIACGVLAIVVYVVLRRYISNKLNSDTL